MKTNILDEGTRYLEPYELEKHLTLYREQLVTTGYKRLTIIGHLDAVCHFGTWLHRSGIAVDEIDALVLDRFDRHRCHCPGGRRCRTLSKRYLRRVRRFVSYLEELGLVRPISTKVKSVVYPEYEGFSRWLLSARGLAPSTVATYQRSIARILPALGSDPELYSAKLIRSVVGTHAQKFGSSDTKNLISALRAFLRFLATNGRCSATLVDAVPKVPNWRLSSLPRYVSTADLELIIDSCDTTRAVGLRDHAVLVLLARLGLRAKDIVDMTIADIDWNNATIRVWGKSRREARLPLPQDAGEAILNYLEKGRPRSDSTQLFLCANAPHRPLACSPTVSSIVKAAVARAGIVDAPSAGTNMMRHSAATSMLRAGASLDAVSTILRHQSTDTTMHYAKIDVSRLNELTVQWPEASSC